MKLDGNFKGKAKRRVLVVRMSRGEAMRTIQSLAQQINTNNPNVGRYEKYTECGTDFSIAVVPE